MSQSCACSLLKFTNSLMCIYDWVLPNYVARHCLPDGLLRGVGSLHRPVYKLYPTAGEFLAEDQLLKLSSLPDQTLTSFKGPLHRSQFTHVDRVHLPDCDGERTTLSRRLLCLLCLPCLSSPSRKQSE